MKTKVERVSGQEAAAVKGQARQEDLTKNALKMKIRPG
jgi:hypothetical protein